MARGALPISELQGSLIDRRLSVAGQVFDLIRREIVGSALPPGMQISEQALSDRFGVSRTPIREALLRLAEEGLVQIVPQVGTYVTRISLAKVYEAQFIREALECAAVRAAVARVGPSDLIELDAIMSRQKTAAVEGDHTGFYTFDEELHAAIARSSGFARIWVVASAEKLQLDRVRMLDMTQRADLGELVSQHQAIVEALRVGDEEAAEAATRLHLRDVFERLQPLIAAHSAYFEDVANPDEPDTT